MIGRAIYGRGGQCGAAARVFAILPLGLSLSGCLGSDNEPVRTASSSDKVAAVMVTPTMVAPWADVSSALAPNFTMSGDAAVAKVLPTTERVSTQVLDALGFSLAAGLPGSSTTRSNTSSTSADTKSATDNAGVTTSTGTGDNATSSSSTKSFTPGTAPTAPTGTPASGTLPTGMTNGGDLGVDPVLQYKAANYLQQAVQLLNTEILHAATRRCYVPYVTKLKVAVMSYQPDMGYDLHTRISFFRHEPDTAAAAPAVAAAANSCPTTPSGIPVVVPLLAADDLQMATKAKAIEEAQQIGLALSAMVHGVGASASFNKVNQKIQAILNNQMSSSLTVSQESENTLYVRIAASNLASGQPSLVGQTYDIAALVLVPYGYLSDADPLLDISSYTEFRNANDGTILPGGDHSAIVTRADRMAKLFLTEMTGSQDRWNALIDSDKYCAAVTLGHLIQASRYEGFVAQLHGSFANAPCMSEAGKTFFFYSDEATAKAYSHTLWANLSSLLADNSIKTSLLRLPRTPSVHVEPTLNPDLLATDDGSASTTMMVTGVTNYAAGSLLAKLVVVQPGTPAVKKLPAVPAVTYTIPASTMTYDATVQVLGITFPSLKKLGITAGSGEQKLVLTPNSCTDTQMPCPTLNGGSTAVNLDTKVVTTSGATTTPAAFTLTSLSPSIVVQKDSTGQALIKLAKLPSKESAVISVTGGVTAVHDPAGATVSLGSDGYTLAANGVYTFDFKNLMRGASVTFSGQEMKGTTKLGTTSVIVPVTDR